jgi:alpha-glucosidase
MKSQLVLAILFSAFSNLVFGQKAVIQSPDQKIVAELFNKQNDN